MTPLARYQQDLKLSGILPDPAQEQAILQLQQIYESIMHAQSDSWWQKIKKRFFKKKRFCIKGLYLWGSVGVGKTYLMDTFFSSLPAQKVKREHFHHFMRYIHEALAKQQGKKDPLNEVAKELSIYSVLCFDEFFVNDIADAMLLGNLLTALFSQGIVLVTTSNVYPDDLYKNGLQRNLFLPAIQKLKEYTTILHLQSLQDYRLRKLSPAGVYFYPLNELTGVRIRQLFSNMVIGRVSKDPIEVLGRLIPVVECSTDIAWFRFSEICHEPRSQQDYLCLAEQFHTIFVSDVPAIKSDQDNVITYFIYLIDILYDAKVKLILSAQVPLEGIYVQGRKLFEFRRTLSRLQEMQTEEYLALPHREE